MLELYLTWKPPCLGRACQIESCLSNICVPPAQIWTQFYEIPHSLVSIKSFDESRTFAWCWVPFLVLNKGTLTIFFPSWSIFFTSDTFFWGALSLLRSTRGRSLTNCRGNLWGVTSQNKRLGRANNHCRGLVYLFKGSTLDLEKLVCWFFRETLVC